MADLIRHREDCSGTGSQQVLEGEDSALLGHAPAWIDLGLVFDGALERLEEEGPVDFIFCVDPWAIQLHRSVDSLAPDTEWILISDLPERASKEDPEYWRQMDEWLGTLPRITIFHRDELQKAIEASDGQAPKGGMGRPFAQKPGAWQWRTISRTAESQPRRQATMVFLVKYSGSLLHLRVFLDSLARLKLTEGALDCVLLANSDAKELDSVLKWFEIAHPRIALRKLEMSSSSNSAWRVRLNQILESVPGALVVLTGDHTILPERFASVCGEIARSSSPPALLSVPMSHEATAHVLLGNLDPVPHYEELLNAFSSSTGQEAVEAARLVAADHWMKGDGDPYSRIQSRCQTQVRPSADALGLLELGDLP